MISRRLKIIFIHSLFRTGSTYLWSTLKKNKKSICYYEPLNEQLLDDKENKIGGMSHIMLPTHKPESSSKKKYADTAIPMMIADLQL